MKFWKEHVQLRIVLMAVCFILGMALIIGGWMMHGMLSGLGIMCVGLIFLLAALMIYNKPFEEPKAPQK